MPITLPWYLQPHQLDMVTQNNAALSEELTSTAEEMNSQALALRDMCNYFTIDAGQNEST